MGLTDTLTQGYSMADIISGTEMRAAILDELRQEVEAIREKHGTVPGLVTILVGENPASISYVTLKVKTALSLGFHEIQDNQPADVSEEALLALIDKYNRDPSIHGILVQLPLPKHIDENKVIYAIDPDKDVTIEYYSEATEVTAQMANTEDAIAVLPQPYVTAAGLQDDTLRVALDLTEEWNKVADTQLITGVTVVRKEYAEEHPDVVAAFLTDYAKSVEAANADLDGTAALCEEQGVVAKAAIAKKALPNCNIVCLTGDELKTNASAYLQVLFDADPKAVGGAMPGDDFYWTAE